MFNIKLIEFAELLGLSSQLDIPKLHTKRVITPREMTPMYIPNSGFHTPKVDGILPHFLVLHWMMRRTLALRIGDSDGIPAYERNLLDALMKYEWFDVFDYIVDEIWNIAINPLRSCGFATYIMCMIEMVAHERFYKDVAHELLCPAVSKDSARRHTFPPPDMAPTRTARSSGASSSSSSNSDFLKMFWDIFAMYRRIDQCMDVTEHRLDIVHRNQEIINSQRDEPLIEFPDEVVYPSVPNPYASLTPAELPAFGIGPSHAPTGNNNDDDGDEEATNDHEEMEDNE
jgi:hypothetical protein